MDVDVVLVVVVASIRGLLVLLLSVLFEFLVSSIVEEENDVEVNDNLTTLATSFCLVD